MKKVVLASRNPIKARATENGFRQAFPGEEINVVAVSVPSGVPDQPFGDAETLLGADNRVVGARERIPDADFWVGLEGGIADQETAPGRREMEAFAWAVVRSAGQRGISRTASFTLPNEIAELVRGGCELGKANDRVFNRTNSKHQEGAVGLLTDGVLDRAGLYQPSVLLALVPFLNPELYGPAT